MPYPNRLTSLARVNLGTIAAWTKKDLASCTVGVSSRATSRASCGRESSESCASADLSSTDSERGEPTRPQLSEITSASDMTAAAELSMSESSMSERSTSKIKKVVPPVVVNI